MTEYEQKIVFFLLVFIMSTVEVVHSFGVYEKCLLIAYRRKLFVLVNAHYGFSLDHKSNTYVIVGFVYCIAKNPFQNGLQFLYISLFFMNNSLRFVQSLQMGSFETGKRRFHSNRVNDYQQQQYRPD